MTGCGTKRLRQGALILLTPFRQFRGLVMAVNREGRLPRVMPLKQPSATLWLSVSALARVLSGRQRKNVPLQDRLPRK